MNAEELKKRTERAALAVIGLTASLSTDRETHVLARQLVRSGTSVGANYRAACRARSKAEFISKIGIAEEEADESVYWIKLLCEAKLVDERKVEPLLREMKELTAIFTAAGRTAKQRRE